MIKYPSWFQILDKPVFHYLQRLVAYSTNIRYFNGEIIRVPDSIKKNWNPFHNHIYEIYGWEAVYEFGKAGDTFIDIGANIGIITVAMSRVAGQDGNVIACEPNPHAYRFLLDTFEVNQCYNAHSLQTLVLDEIGVFSFNISSADDLGVRSSIAYKDPGGKTVKLPGMTIDSFTEDGSQLDYIKIDAEGAEMRILTGAI